MFNVGTSELVIIFLLILVLLGPKKLPEIARSLGRFIAQARKTSDDLKKEINKEIESSSEDKIVDKAPKEKLESYDKSKTEEEK